MTITRDPKEPAVVAITGVSGYLGSVLLELLHRDPRVCRIVGVDQRNPNRLSPKLTFFQMDIRDKEIARILRKCQVTHVAHLAFLLEHSHNRNRIKDINVGGARNVFKACAGSSVKRIVFSSSSCVFGAHPENPIPLPEDGERHACRQVQYTLDKIEVEDLCAQFQKDHPGITLSVLRPVTIVGPRMDNFISKFLEKPFILIPRGYDPLWQYIHERDCARAFQTALFHPKHGVYNVGADQPIPFSVILKRLNRPVFSVPRMVLKSVTSFFWHLRMTAVSDMPGALIDYLCFPPILNNEKIKKELGFVFEYDCEAAVSEFLGMRSPDAKLSKELSF